jgi:hypothetical protein
MVYVLILAVPLTLTAKGIYPINNIEIYGGAGIGIYIWKADFDASQAGAVSDSDDDDGAEFGFHVMAGVNFNISDNLFLGIEAKHIWTGEVTAEFELAGSDLEEETDLNGFTITGLIGFRFRKLMRPDPNSHFLIIYGLKTLIFSSLMGLKCLALPVTSIRLFSAAVAATKASPALRP